MTTVGYLRLRRWTLCLVWRHLYRSEWQGQQCYYGICHACGYAKRDFDPMTQGRPQ